jgi:hypothetical protein
MQYYPYSDTDLPRPSCLDDLVRKHPPFFPAIEDQSASQIHKNKGNSVLDPEVFSKRIFPLPEDYHFPTQHPSIVGTNESEEDSLVSSAECVDKVDAPIL